MGRNRISRVLSVLCAVLYALVGVLWTVKAVRTVPIDRWTLFLALIWFVGAAIWPIRSILEHKKYDQQKKADGGNDNG